MSILSLNKVSHIFFLPLLSDLIFNFKLKIHLILIKGIKFPFLEWVFTRFA